MNVLISLDRFNSPTSTSILCCQESCTYWKKKNFNSHNLYLDKNILLTNPKVTFSICMHDWPNQKQTCDDNSLLFIDSRAVESTSVRGNTCHLKNYRGQGILSTLTLILALTFVWPRGGGCTPRVCFNAALHKSKQATDPLLGNLLYIFCSHFD